MSQLADKIRVMAQRDGLAPYDRDALEQAAQLLDAHAALLEAVQVTADMITGREPSTGDLDQLYKIVRRALNQNKGTTTMKTVWVVEQGSYSDYRVIGVFSTQANAERIKELINAQDPYEPAEVAEWPFDPGIEWLRKGYTPWTVLMQRDGTVESIELMDRPSAYGNTTVRLWERTKAPYYQNKNIPDVLHGTAVWAKDAAHAIKIMNEHRAQFIALGKWKEPQP